MLNTIRSCDVKPFVMNKLSRIEKELKLINRIPLFLLPVNTTTLLKRFITFLNKFSRYVTNVNEINLSLSPENC